MADNSHPISLHQLRSKSKYVSCRACHHIGPTRLEFEPGERDMLVQGWGVILMLNWMCCLAPALKLFSSEDSIHYCSTCSLRLATWDRQRDETFVEKYETTTRPSTDDPVDSINGAPPPYTTRDTNIALQKLPTLDRTSPFRSPFGSPTLQYPTRVLCLSQGLDGDSSWTFITPVGSVGCVGSAHSYTITPYRLPFRNSNRPHDFITPRMTIYRRNPWGCESAIGTATIFTSDWNIDATINGRELKLRTPRESHGSCSLKWWSEWGLLVVKDGAGRAMFGEGALLVDCYGRVGARSGMPGWERGRLEFYGEVEEELLDEVVGVLLLARERAMMRRDWEDFLHRECVRLARR